MSIFSFIKKLNDASKKTNIQDDVAYTKKIMDETTLPMLASFRSAVTVTKPKAKAFPAAEDIFYTKTRMRAKSLAVDLEQLVRNARSNLNFVEKQIEKEVSDVVYAEAINLRHAQLFQASSGIALIADLTIQIINHLILSEHIACGGEGEITSGEEKSFVEKMRQLATLLARYGQEPRSFEAVMAKIPEANVSPKNFSQVQAAYARDGDPWSGDDVVANGFIPHPIGFIRGLWADFLIARYESNKAQRKKFELLVLALKAQQAGENTANLQKQISYYDNQIQKLADKISAFEERYR